MSKDKIEMSVKEAIERIAPVLNFCRVEECDYGDCGKCHAALNVIIDAATKHEKHEKHKKEK